MTTATVVVLGQVERSRRTSESPATIIEVDWPAAQHPAFGSGHSIRYSFAADGVVRTSTTLRAWSVESIRSSKVCYEPGNPDNQELVKGTSSCP